MNNTDALQAKLSSFIALDGEKSREEIAGYIVGELIGNPDGRYDGLESQYPDIARIADLASDLEWSNGSSEDLDAMWQELTQLVTNVSINNQ